VPNLNLRGLIPAVVLPMTENFEPELVAYRRYLRWVVDQGPVAIAVNVDTGEGPHLSPAERRQVLDTALDEVGHRVPVIAGLSASYTEQAREFAREAARAGASALLVFPIPAFQGTPLPDELPYAYHAAIADAVETPLILFQLQPALGGVIFSVETLARLVEIPSVVAIKEASFDALRFVQTRDALRHVRPITLLTGNDNFIYESFVLGAEGALIGQGAIAVREQVEMITAGLAGDFARAEALNRALMVLVTACFAAPVRNYRARIKEGLVAQGVIPRATVRPPLMPVSDAERDRVRAALKELACVAEGVA
jgi:4-hydroxy-tetrahydrodipicolinate synthase